MNVAKKSRQDANIDLHQRVARIMAENQNMDIIEEQFKENKDLRDKVQTLECQLQEKSKAPFEATEKEDEVKDIVYKSSDLKDKMKRRALKTERRLQEETRTKSTLQADRGQVCLEKEAGQCEAKYYKANCEWALEENKDLHQEIETFGQEKKEVEKMNNAVSERTQLLLDENSKIMVEAKKREVIIAQMRVYLVKYVRLRQIFREIKQIFPNGKVMNKIKRVLQRIAHLEMDVEKYKKEAEESHSWQAVVIAKEKKIQSLEDTINELARSKEALGQQFQMYQSIKEGQVSQLRHGFEECRSELMTCKYEADQAQAKIMKQKLIQQISYAQIKNLSEEIGENKGKSKRENKQLQDEIDRLKQSTDDQDGQVDGAKAAEPHQSIYAVQDIDLHSDVSDSDYILL